MFKHNVGTADRMIRVALGLALLAFFVLSESSARWVGLVGIVPLLTGTLGTCPLYTLLGFSTCRLKPNA